MTRDAKCAYWTEQNVEWINGFKKGLQIEQDIPAEKGVWGCSNCLETWQLKEGETPQDNQMYYCPNCGVKMKLGEQMSTGTAPEI